MNEYRDRVILVSFSIDWISTVKMTYIYSLTFEDLLVYKSSYVAFCNEKIWTIHRDMHKDSRHDRSKAFCFESNQGIDISLYWHSSKEFSYWYWFTCLYHKWDHHNLFWLQILSVISTIDDLNYPEKTDTYYIVNAPYIFSSCWKVWNEQMMHFIHFVCTTWPPFETT